MPRLRFHGIAVDSALNAAVQLDAEISPPDASVRTFVVEAREDLQIADQARGLLCAAQA